MLGYGRRSAMVVLALALAVGLWGGAWAAGQDDPVSAEIAALKGNWKVTKMEANGETPPPGVIDHLQLVINDSAITLKAGGRSENMSYQIDPKAQPKTFDMKPDAPEKKDVTVLGIYELSGDVLKLCWTTQTTRPTAFSAKAGENRIFLELARVK
ncbi:MAG TPA: TIGR03067 domain-containing protein [Gemmatales bacterium]|nr:TIGR03067 domain-containing protein [Gemmatales bacterium]